jgi:hypothetical protein
LKSPLPLPPIGPPLLAASAAGIAAMEDIAMRVSIASRMICSLIGKFACGAFAYCNNVAGLPLSRMRHA